MFEKLIELLKNLYIKINCFMCCKSKCSVEVSLQNDETENDDSNNPRERASSI